mgnify:CR=1 FL=1
MVCGEHVSPQSVAVDVVVDVVVVVIDIEVSSFGGFGVIVVLVVATVDFENGLVVVGISVLSEAVLNSEISFVLTNWELVSTGILNKILEVFVVVVIVVVLASRLGIGGLIVTSLF